MLAVIGVVYAANHPSGTTGPGPAIESPPPILHTPKSTPSPEPTPHVRRHTRTPQPQPTHTVHPIPVTVLNNSTRSGLASMAADQLRAKQWPIRLVGNFRGRLPVSSLYYLPGQHQVAELLAKEFPAIQRVLPRFAGLPGHGLTLVVTREWPA